MNSKVFIILVIILTLLIGASLFGLVHSINKYQQVQNDFKGSHLENGELVDNTNVVNTSNATNTLAPTPEKLTTKPTTVIPKPNDEYILPSDTRIITKDEIKDFDYEKLNLAYNEIFARHGHDFKTNSLKEYFSQKSWYKPEIGKTVSTTDLTKTESENLTTIKARIDEIK